MSKDTHFDRETIRVRPCDHCGQAKPDVRLDRDTGNRLCDSCWFTTPPSGGSPEPPRKRIR